MSSKPPSKAPSSNQPITKQNAAFPPSNTPVVVAEKVVESRNLFLTSNDLIPTTGDGQNYTWNLGNDAITTRSPAQYIRLTLLNFNMYKTWTSVNITNNTVVVKHLTGLYDKVQVDPQNYASVFDVVDNFADQLQASIATATGMPIADLTKTVNTPNVGPAGTTNNVLDITFTDVSGGRLPTTTQLSNNDFNIWAPIDTKNAPFNSAISDANEQIATEGGDAAVLLGGDRIGTADIPGSPTSGFGGLPTSTFYLSGDASGNTLRVLGKYPAQRFTEPNVYLRMIPAPDTLASQNLDKVQTLGNNNNNVSPASILAEIKQQNEMIQYTTPGEGHFFANLYQKALTTIQLQVTDSKGRLVPEFTAFQGSRGNRFFTCNFRADIIMDTAYGETPDPQAQQIFLPHIYPPRFDSNVLVNQRNNMPSYGRSPAF